MKKLFLFMAATVVASFTVVAVRHAKDNARAEKMTQKMHDVDTYTKGFWDGANSAQRHINFNTNTGKFTLELTNLMNDIKP